MGEPALSSLSDQDPTPRRLSNNRAETFRNSRSGKSTGGWGALGLCRGRQPRCRHLSLARPPLGAYLQGGGGVATGVIGAPAGTAGPMTPWRLSSAQPGRLEAADRHRGTERPSLHVQCHGEAETETAPLEGSSSSSLQMTCVQPIILPSSFLFRSFLFRASAPPHSPLSLTPA